MKLRPSVASVISEHVVFELESIDRVYLNVYVPRLQREAGVAAFFRFHRGHLFASSALMDPISKDFVARLEGFAKQHRVPVVQFRKGERKDDVAAQYLKKFKGEEGVLFIGKAQEKTRVFRTERRRNSKTGATYPWLTRSTAMVNNFYIYCVDRDFGPFFLKFCTYFPYNAKLCLNGHEWLKRQLKHRGIGFEALDNGLLSCADPKRAQTLSNALSAEKIDALLRKWLRRLPHPYSPADRKAGYRYQISILQAEFSLTQVLDRPTAGRLFFEEIIRENLDIGRPSQVQLIFGRRVNTRTPGRFRTRVITEGVIPSLHVDYKSSRFGRSAFKPIDVSWTSRPSLTTASLANKPTIRSCTQLSVTVNGLPPYASTIGACKRCSPPWSCSARISTAFAIGNCESTWLNCWASTQPHIPRAE